MVYTHFSLISVIKLKSTQTIVWTNGRLETTRYTELLTMGVQQVSEFNKMGTSKAVDIIFNCYVPSIWLIKIIFIVIVVKVIKSIKLRNAIPFLLKLISISLFRIKIVGYWISLNFQLSMVAFIFYINIFILLTRFIYICKLPNMYCVYCIVYISCTRTEVWRTIKYVYYISCRTTKVVQNP